MPNHSNSVSLRGYLVSAIIDHKYTPLEVFQYWQQIAPAFPFLGQAQLNREELTWDHERMIAVINKTETSVAPTPEIKMSGDAEILDAYFGIPVYKPGEQETNELMVAFMLPELPEEGNPTLNWDLGPSIRLGLTRNIVFESPYFILSIDINPGVWGYRHLQYKAIEDVFQQLSRMEGGTPLEEETAREAAQLSARLHTWETKEVDFERIREQLWAAAYQLAEHFSKDGKAAILQEVNGSGAPHDLAVNAPNVYVPETPVYDLDIFKHWVWMEQMSWGSVTLDRTLAYWTARKTTSEWDDFYNTCMRAYKASWPAVVKVLKQPPVSDVDMERLLYFTADVNWPGAGEALMFLQGQGLAALKSVDAAIEEATRQKDEYWLENLQWVRNWIVGENINFEEGNVS